MRVQVTLSDDLVARIDDYARSIGQSRSAVCGLAIGQYIYSVDQTKNILSNLSGIISQELTSSSAQTSTKKVPNIVSKTTKKSSKK